jgi:hypothetical protein
MRSVRVGLGLLLTVTSVGAARAQAAPRTVRLVCDAPAVWPKQGRVRLSCMVQAELVAELVNPFGVAFELALMDPFAAGVAPDQGRPDEVVDPFAVPAAPARR